jgi:hypothetical protein
MMEVLKRIQSFLYEEDIEYLESFFGYGWSAQIREIVHDWVREHKLQRSANE